MCRRTSSRIDVEEGLADVAREGEVAREVAAVEIVVEDAADAARLAAVRQEEIVVAPFLEARVVAGSWASQAAWSAAWKASVSACVRAPSA